MAQKRIDFFGQFRPTGVDQTAGAQFRALAGLGEQVTNIAAQVGGQIASDEGRKAGIADVQAGKAPEERGSFTAYDRAYTEAATLAYRANVRRDTKVELTNLQNKYANDPEAFKAVADAHLAGVTKGLPDELAFVIGDDIANSITDRYTTLNNNYFEAQRRQSIADVSQSLDDIQDDILNAAREGNTQSLTRYQSEYDAIIQRGISSGLVDPVAAQQQNESIKEQVSVNGIIGGLDRIFNGELSDIDKVNQGQEYIQNELENLPDDLSPNQRDLLSKSLNASLAEQVRKSQEISAEEQQRIALETNSLLIEAEYGDKPAASVVADAYKMFMSGELSEKELLSVQTKILNRQKKGFETAQSFEQVSRRLAGDDSIVLDSSVVNSYFEQQVLPQIENLTPIEQSTAMANYAIATGQVPSALKNRITNGIVSENPDLVQQSVDIVSRLDDIPGIDIGLSKEQEAFAFTAATLIGVTDPQRAIELARKQTDPTNKARIESRIAAIKEEEFEDDYQDWVDSEFGGLGKPDLDEINRYNMQKEFKTLFEAKFVAGMDEDKAKERTVAEMQRNWKYSDSVGRWMKYPPDDYYATTQGSEYIGRQLKSYVNSAFIGQGKPEQIMLVSDEETGRMARAGFAPDYQVQYIDANGEIQMFSKIDPKDGKLKRIRWSPNKDKENERIKMANQGIIEDVAVKPESEIVADALSNMRGF